MWLLIYIQANILWLTCRMIQRKSGKLPDVCYLSYQRVYFDPCSLCCFQNNEQRLKNTFTIKPGGTFSTSKPLFTSGSQQEFKLWCVLLFFFYCISVSNKLQKQLQNTGKFSVFIRSALGCFLAAIQRFLLPLSAQMSLSRYTSSPCCCINTCKSFSRL